MSDPRSRVAAGAIWRRRKTGALVRITKVHDISTRPGPSSYYDIAWETVEKPVRRGVSFEDYWLRNCEPVDHPERATSETDESEGEK